MRLALWTVPGNLVGPGSLWGWGWTLLGFLILFGLWIQRPQDLRSLRGLPSMEVGGFFALAVLTALTPVLVWDRFPGLPFRVGIPLFIWLPYLIWGGRLRPGALGLAGLMAGAAAGFLGDGRFLQLPWMTALVAVLIGAMRAQSYVGRPFALLRQPVVAALGGGLFGLLLQAISWSAFYPSWPEALDGIWTLTEAVALPAGLSALLSGAIAQALCRRWPHRFQPPQAPQWPFYVRGIHARFLVFFSLWMGVLILALFGSLAALAIRQAYAEHLRAVDQGVRPAGDQLAYFLHTGETLLSDLAALGIPLQEPPALIAPILQRFVQTGPIFHAVLLTGADGEILTAYPADASSGGLSLPERAALAQARAARSTIRTEIHPLPDGAAGLSFIAPLEGEPPPGFLIGRVRIGEHPALREVLAFLRGDVPSGEGFLVDRKGRILLHPDPERLLDNFPLPASSEAQALDLAQPSATGTMDLLHLRRLPGSEWWAVVRYPRSALIRRAVDLILPSAGILVAAAGVGAMLLSALSGLLTRRVRWLAAAAERMAGGQLEAPIISDGPDEVGQLAEAMEHMRHGLRGRLADLSLLLELNQALMAARDLAWGLSEVARALERALPPARARILIPGGDGALRAFTAAGESPPEPADELCGSIGRAREEPLWVEHVLRDPDLPPVLQSGRYGQALGILPIRQESEITGVAWLAFPRPRRITESEDRLARLILAQASVFIGQARLYEDMGAERERLRAVLESSPDALMLVDAQGALRYLNPAAERFIGMPAAKAVGQPAATLLRDAELVELLNEPIPIGQIRSREFQRPDGRALWAGRYDLYLEDGRAIGRLLFVRDITPFKALDRLKSDFIAAISHDLRSPLTYMRGFVTMLGMAGPLTARQQEYIEKIMGGLDQMTRMIEDLLELKRIEEGIGQRGICRLSDLLRDVFHEMRPQAMARGLRMSLEVKGQGVVHGDPAWLRRAIANLVDNAIKYTPEGGAITLGLAEPNGREAVIWVRDTGMGIAPADQARIFEKFYRVRRKETAHVKGSGLGLALVKSIVEWHEGRVWVESQLGHGSTFYIALPLVAPQGTRNR